MNALSDYIEDEVYGQRLLISVNADQRELLSNIRAARAILHSFLDHCYQRGTSSDKVWCTEILLDSYKPPFLLNVLAVVMEPGIVKPRIILLVSAIRFLLTTRLLVVVIEQSAENHHENYQRHMLKIYAINLFRWQI